MGSHRAAVAVHLSSHRLLRLVPGTLRIIIIIYYATPPQHLVAKGIMISGRPPVVRPSVNTYHFIFVTLNYRFPSVAGY